MKITICIGSSCHLKGSRLVVEELQELINEEGLSEQIDLAGTFCMGNCQNGVCVKVDDQDYSLTQDTTYSFFEKTIKPRFTSTVRGDS